MLLHTPRWMLRLLIAELPALSALEQQAEATAALLPHLSDDGRREILQALAQATRSLQPEPPAPVIIEHNPEKAADWFRSIGIRVTPKKVTSG